MLKLLATTQRPPGASLGAHKHAQPFHCQGWPSHLKAPRPGTCTSNAAQPGSEVIASQREDSSASGEAVQQQTPSNSGAAESLEVYARLKKQLLARAQRAGGFLALYLFLSQGLVATVCSGVGSAAGYLYLRLLIADVDKVTAGTEVPLFQAQRVMTQPLRAIAYGIAAYRQALTPRLLVPLLLAAGVGYFNRTNSEQLSNLQELDILFGFLCYKAGLFLRLYDDVKPKFDPTMLSRPVRSTLTELPDTDEEEKNRRLRERKRH